MYGVCAYSSLNWSHLPIFAKIFLWMVPKNVTAVPKIFWILFDSLNSKLLYCNNYIVELWLMDDYPASKQLENILLVYVVVTGS